jgi:hypothetical protein
MLFVPSRSQPRQAVDRSLIGSVAQGALRKAYHSFQNLKRCRCKANTILPRLKNFSASLMKFEGISMFTVQRRKARTKVTHPAKIIVKAVAAYDCIVDDLSALGACVSFDAAATADLPHNFDLSFDNCRTFWSCRVIWRNKNGGRIGVTWKNPS